MQNIEDADAETKLDANLFQTDGQLDELERELESDNRSSSK